MSVEFAINVATKKIKVDNFVHYLSKQKVKGYLREYARGK
jgi:hypothetical protein